MEKKTEIQNCQLILNQITIIIQEGRRRSGHVRESFPAPMGRAAKAGLSKGNLGRNGQAYWLKDEAKGVSFLLNIWSFISGSGKVSSFFPKTNCLNGLVPNEKRPQNHF